MMKVIRKKYPLGQSPMKDDIWLNDESKWVLVEGAKWMSVQLAGCKMQPAGCAMFQRPQEGLGMAPRRVKDFAIN